MNRPKFIFKHTVDLTAKET